MEPIHITYLTMVEVAERLSVSKETVRRMMKRGRLHGKLVTGPHGRRYLIEERSIPDRPPARPPRY